MQRVHICTFGSAGGDRVNSQEQVSTLHCCVSNYLCTFTSVRMIGRMSTKLRVIV